jgi:hypothetical protein
MYEKLLSLFNQTTSCRTHGSAALRHFYTSALLNVYAQSMYGKYEKFIIILNRKP